MQVIGLQSNSNTTKTWAGGAVDPERVADMMHTVLNSDHIHEIHDVGVRVFD